MLGGNNDFGALHLSLLSSGILLQIFCGSAATQTECLAENTLKKSELLKPIHQTEKGAEHRQYL